MVGCLGKMSKTYRIKKYCDGWKVTDAFRNMRIYKDGKSLKQHCMGCELEHVALKRYPKIDILPAIFNAIFYKEEKVHRKHARRKIRRNIYKLIHKQEYEKIPTKEKKTQGYLTW